MISARAELNHSPQMPNELPKSEDVRVKPARNRRRSDEDVWLSEARYRAIVEDQQELVCRFRPDATLTFANDAYCQFFGLHRDEVVGRQYQPMVNATDQARVRMELDGLSRANPVVLIQNRVTHADGSERWTEWSNRALYDESGRLLEIQAVGRDITEWKRTDEYRARLAAIVDSADIAIYATTLGGAITSWNRAAERMFGYTADEAIGQSVAILVAPDGSHDHSEIAARVGRGETLEHVEIEKIVKGGGRIPISLTVSPIRDASGQITGISRIARDVTERRHAERELQEREARFRLMADHAPVLIWIADDQNRGVYFNQTWIDFTGVPLDQQLGDGWLSLIHPDDRQATAAYYQQHFDRREPFTVEFRLKHRSGGYRWVQDTGQPLFRSDGVFNGYIGSSVDIEERKRIESFQEEAVMRASEAREAAEQASRLKDEFLAIVSHELRTPLNAILGWTQLLRGGTLAGDATVKALDTIERNARMQARLVEDLLDVSRIVSGKLGLRIEMVHLANVVRAAVESVGPAATTKGLELVCHPIDPQLSVSGDPTRLQQAIWNLLTNAIKFTPRGGRVDVEVRLVHGQAAVTVRDTGIGIRDEMLPFIFDRFRQADSRTTRVHGGLGLGLAIVHHIALAHGGSVNATSAGEGKGATFELLLPARAGQPTPSVTPPERSNRLDLEGRQILVVDDEADARELTRTILEGCGCVVVTAASVGEALDAVCRTRPDVLIADIGMPHQDGWDLIRLLRSIDECREIPAIALTAYAGVQHREAAINAGYDAHLAKPVDPDALCAAVLDLCRPRTVEPS